MANFYFNHQQCGGLHEDTVGHECADLAAAEMLAFEIAREIIAEEVRLGEICLSCQIDILDDQRRLLLTVPFRRAVIVTGV